MPSSLSDEEIILEDLPEEINPYEVLGLEKSATEKEIRTAYRRAALKHHPGTFQFASTASAHIS
jgi:DnaJ family protein C protein 9